MTGSLSTRVLPPLLADTLLAAVFVLVSQIELHHKVDDGFQAGPMWLNIPLVVLMTAPLAGRRRSPRLALGIMVAAAFVPGLFAAHTMFFWGSLVPMAIATYSVARHQDGIAAEYAWFVGPLMLGGNAIHMTELRSLSNAAFAIGLFVIAWLIGRVLRKVSSQRESLADALAELEIRQEEREVAVVQAERRRIAIEMHDVVAHAVSLMAVQVGAARMTLEHSGAAVPDQLRAAEMTGREALSELRRTLGVLRDATDVSRLDPLPGLAEVPALIRSFGDAGLEVRLVRGDLSGLPVSLDLAAYRILQESLTNVLKHAGKVVVMASIGITGDLLIIDVDSPHGRGSDVVAGGNGLFGMQERVAMFGGRLTVDSKGGRFRVRAELRVDRSVSTDRLISR